MATEGATPVSWWTDRSVVEFLAGGGGRAGPGKALKRVPLLA